MSDIAINVEEVLVQEKVNEELVDAKGQHLILFENYVAALIGDDVSQIEKKFSYEDLHSIISNVLNRRNEETIEGFQLPSNCFFFAKSSTGIQLSCYYAERIAEMRHNSHKYMVKTPNFVISHQLSKNVGTSWRHTGAKFFCTDAKIGALPKGHIWTPDGNKKVYLSPFPNTYAEGNMCYGGNAMPTQFTDNNLTGLNWYYQFLFESPFNDDLGLRSLKNEVQASTWFKQLADIATENKPFPYELLRGHRS